jgi:hypothetical protein
MPSLLASPESASIQLATESEVTLLRVNTAHLFLIFLCFNVFSFSGNLKPGNPITRLIAHYDFAAATGELCQCKPQDPIMPARRRWLVETHAEQRL